MKIKEVDMRKLLMVWVILFFASVLQAQDVSNATISQINSYRNRSNLSAFVPNSKLSHAAQHHANWMANNYRMVHLEGQKPKINTREVWSKSTWHPINRAVKYGYLQVDILAHPKASDYVGEIIAHGGPRSVPGRFNPVVIVRGWMNSTGHRKTILGNYKEIGVGFAKTRQGDAFWCVVVGKTK